MVLSMNRQTLILLYGVQSPLPSQWKSLWT